MRKDKEKCFYLQFSYVHEQFYSVWDLDNQLISHVQLLSSDNVVEVGCPKEPIDWRRLPCKAAESPWLVAN